MNQLEFGKELVKIRKAKGFTQSELAEKCDITIRTIQRIETGIVMPRSFTIKALSVALDFDFHNQLLVDSESQRLFFYNKIILQLIDLFNLKTNTMKKATLMSVILGLIGTGLFVLSHNGNSQVIKNNPSFSIVDSIKTISKNEAIKRIKEINRKASIHNKSLDVIETYAKGSNYNFDTYVLLSEMIANFSHSTEPALEIANVVFVTNKECDLFNDVAPLIFLNNYDCDNYVKMAKAASQAKTDDEINGIKEQINKYKQQAEFKTLIDAFNKQGKI